MIRIRADSSPGEVRLAAIADGALQDFALWRPGRPDGLGDVYRARVIAHVSSMAGAFVALPDGDGFLPDSEGGAGAVAGALVTVRVTRAAQSGKGARLSAKLEQLEGDPGLVALGPSPLDDLVARYPAADIAVDDPAIAAEWQRRLGLPVVVEPAPLAPWAEDIEALGVPDLDLPGGMRATIHPTPALIAIDLDMAAATRSSGLKPRVQLAANLAALPALARQIRLRNLSGAILVDPAGISAKRRKLLGPALAEALAEDPLHARLLGFTALGFAEISRPRQRQALHELLAGPHAAGLAALRAIAREAAVAPHLHWRLRAAPDVLAALDRDPLAPAALAHKTGRPFIAMPDPALAPASWQIERGP